MDLPNEERYSMDVGAPQRQAFQKSKEALCKAPLLQHLDPSKPYVVVKNALGLATGGVLMQD